MTTDAYISDGPHALTLGATALIVAAVLAAVALFTEPSPALDGKPPTTAQPTNETGPNQ